MDPILIGAICTGVAAVLTSVVEALRRSRTVAIEAAEKAVGTISKTMESQQSTLEKQEKTLEKQETRLINQQTQILNLDATVKEIDGRHRVAIDHIAEREDAAAEVWSVRPAWLPPVPSLILPEVDNARRKV